jgi:hypothetical protein
MTNHQIYLQTCRELVIEVEATVEVELHDSVNGYLISLLARNFDCVNAITYNYDFLATAKHQEQGFLAKTQFIDAAERCLMISGISPFVAERRGIPPKHFTYCGQLLYNQAAHCTRPTDEFMNALAINFGKMRDVISATFDKTAKTYRQRRQLIDAGSTTTTLMEIKLI